MKVFELEYPRYKSIRARIPQGLELFKAFEVFNAIPASSRPGIVSRWPRVEVSRYTHLT